LSGLIEVGALGLFPLIWTKATFTSSSRIAQTCFATLQDPTRTHGCPGRRGLL
jgi:hypothetical protein